MGRKTRESTKVNPFIATNNVSDAKRETLAERAARPSGIAAPGLRAVAGSGIAKPMTRSNTMAPGVNYKGPQHPRSKSSMERVRPQTFSGNGAFSRSTSIIASKVGGIPGPRPPSAQELRSGIRPPSAQDLRSAKNGAASPPLNGRPPPTSKGSAPSS